MFIGRDYQNTKSYSEKVAGTIDDEVKLLIDKAYAQCTEILKAHSEQLNRVVEYLLDKESMTGDQFRSIMEGKEVGEYSTTAMFDHAKEEPSEE